MPDKSENGPHPGDRLSGYLDGELPEAERREIEIHLTACPACRDALSQLTNLSKEVSSLRFRYENEDGVPALAEETRARPAWTPRVWAAAAVLALTAAGAGWLWLNLQKKPVPKTPPLTAEILSRRLTDGSTLSWTPGTKIEWLASSGEAPAVSLVRGTLYANVAPHAADTPFVIETPFGPVKALGTRFRIHCETGDPNAQENAMTTNANMKGSRLSVAVFAGLVVLTSPQGEVRAGPGEEIRAAADGAPVVHHAERLSALFARYHTPVKADAVPSFKETRFPIDPAKIQNWQEINLTLSPAARSALLERGFAVAPWGPDEFPEAYEILEDKRVPVLVTSDALLHHYHIHFEESLAALETELMAPDLAALVRHLRNRAVSAIAGSPAALRSSTELAAQYLAVADALLSSADGGTEFPPALEMVGLKGGWFLAQLDEMTADGKESPSEETVKAFFAEHGHLQKFMGFDPNDGREWMNFDRKIKNLAEAESVRRFLMLYQKKFEKPAATEIATAAGLPALLPLPAGLQEEVNQELSFILAHAERVAASPLFGCAEDYTQYIPRSHYTRTPLLSRYFRAMIWLGRMTFLIQETEDRGDRSVMPKGIPITMEGSADIHRQTLAAFLISDWLARETLADGRKACDLLDRIYATSAFFSGLSDDLTWRDYREVAHELKETPEELATFPEALAAAQRHLTARRKPAVYGGTGMITVWEDETGAPEKIAEATQGLRLLGQRFTPDAHWMQRLVYPAVKKYSGSGAPFTYCETNGFSIRGFARGLDVLAAMGSDRALAILEKSGDADYDGYEKAMKTLRLETQRLPETARTANLYSGWLWSLEPLLHPLPEGYPSFMRSTAWQDKSLNAALGSWGTLRHDTILYAKQMYAAEKGGDKGFDIPASWVEPLPELYARLLSLSAMTRQGLSEIAGIDKKRVEEFQRFENLLEKILAIAQSELAGTPLSKEQKLFLARFKDQLEYATAGNADTKTVLAADVCTGPVSSGLVVEAATGTLDLCVVAVPCPDGTFFLAAGPVYSTYEFKHPAADRLTDGAWRQMLKTGAPARPDWQQNFLD